MAHFVQDCLRCGAKLITFDVLGDNPAPLRNGFWSFQVFGRCRSCGDCSIAVFETAESISGTYYSGALSSTEGGMPQVVFRKFLTVADNRTVDIPEFLPTAVSNCFKEGAAAFNIGAYNASAAMFRLALDIATKGLLPDEPPENGGPNSVQRKRLFDRLRYLFDRRVIAPELQDLADCIREDGNDGAHDGTLTKFDAEDLIDFAQQLLERVYSEPERLKAAKLRREARRAT